MRRYLFLGVFFAGFTSLAVELSASRLLGNYFGSSNLVWAVIIGLILVYLSIGYSIGGRWADRSPKITTFFSILCWAGLLVGLIPMASRPILQLASKAFDQLQIGLLAGSFTTVLVLFSVPVILLGTASPFAIRLAISDTANSGEIAGRIYTVSTLGSFLGTFLPVLLFIPAVGTYKTFLILGLTLLVTALVGIWRTVSLSSALKKSWMLLVLMILSLIGFKGYDKIAMNIIYEDESAYNYIQVQEIDGFRLLRLNEGQGIHSIYNPTDHLYAGHWQHTTVAPFFYPPETSPLQIERIAILGLAAGTSANLAVEAFPGVVIDGYEIDPDIIQTGYQFFEMDQTNLNAYAQDARVGLRNSPEKYDVISIDAYRPPYIPWHLTTQEFFQETWDHLTENGSMVINVVRTFENRQLLNNLFQTIHSIYPSTYIVDIPDTLNSMIFATKSETNPINLISNYIRLDSNQSTPASLLSAIEVAIINAQPAPRDGQILTDDHAPIEWIINTMIWDLVQSEFLEKLQ